MYNEERKERFIAQYTRSSQTARYARTIFRKFEKYENEVWHDDVCTQPAKVLEPILNNEIGVRIKTIERALFFLREYIKWCEKNGIKTLNELAQIEINTVEAVREKMVASPMHLQKKLDKVFYPESLESIDCIYRAYLWMAFAGLEDEDALEVEIADVDLNDLVIRHNNKIYQLYHEAKTTFEQACNLTEFRHKHENYESDLMMPRFPGTKLMRGIQSNIKRATVCGIITKRTTRNNVSISYKKIYYSGIFYRMYELERMGEEVSFSDYVADLMQRKEYTFNKNRTYNKVANKLMREMKDDYDRWKFAFNT